MSRTNPKQAFQLIVNNDEILLSGVLDFDTTPKILSLLQKHFKENQKTEQSLLVLNLGEITKSDSSGLALLIGLVREAEKNNFVLKINNMPKKLKDLASLSGLAAILPYN